jgi:hypothetical protein
MQCRQLQTAVTFEWWDNFNRFYAMGVPKLNNGRIKKKQSKKGFNWDVAYPRFMDTQAGESCPQLLAEGKQIMFLAIVDSDVSAWALLERL